MAGPLALFLAGAAASAAGAQQPEPGVAGPALPRIVPDCRTEAERDEAVVCGRRERSPYRIPEQQQRFDPFGEVPSVSLERHRLLEVGESGIGSCSPVGPGGFTGCQLRGFREDMYQRGGKKRGF